MEKVKGQGMGRPLSCLVLAGQGMVAFGNGNACLD
jgi:hypothetical protein